MRRPSQRASWMHSLLRTQLRTARSPPSTWERSAVSVKTSSDCLVMGTLEPTHLVPQPRTPGHASFSKSPIHPHAGHSQRVPPPPSSNSYIKCQLQAPLATPALGQRPPSPRSVSHWMVGAAHGSPLRVRAPGRVWGMEQMLLLSSWNE